MPANSSIPGDVFGQFATPIYASPQYQAVMRQVLEAESIAGAARLARVDAAEAAYIAQVPYVQYQGERQRRTISGSYGARNLRRSGVHEQAQADQRASEASKLADLETRRAGEVSAAEMDYVSAISDARTRASEAVLEAESNLIAAGFSQPSMTTDGQTLDGSTTPEQSMVEEDPRWRGGGGGGMIARRM